MKASVRQVIAALFLWPVSLTAANSDADPIPDAWEDSHYMDKHNPDDAAIDFDRDGLSALEEYILQEAGLGEGPRPEPGPGW